MNRKQTIAAIKALSPDLTVRFSEGEYRVSINPVVIFRRLSGLSGKGAIAKSEAMAHYTNDAEDAVGTARDMLARWEAPSADERQAAHG